MWNLKSPNFNLITSIKSFDFSTLYTTIPPQKLKSRLATIKGNSFLHKNGNRRYRIICLFRIAVGPDEKFGLDRVRITEGFMFR